eukprot:s30_g46.t1
MGREVAHAHELLDLAKARKWHEVKDFVSSNPSLINAQPCGRYSVLHQAAEAGHAAVVRFLLEQRADVNAKTSGGQLASDLTKDSEVRAMLHRCHAEAATRPARHSQPQRPASQPQRPAGQPASQPASHSPIQPASQPQRPAGQPASQPATAAGQPATAAGRPASQPAAIQPATAAGQPATAAGRPAGQPQRKDLKRKKGFETKERTSNEKRRLRAKDKTSN